MCPTPTRRKPDIPSSGPLYEDGYNAYPANPLKANPPTPPANGGKIDIFTTAFLPLPPNPVDQNPAWQEVKKQLNTTVNFNTVSQADFQAKFAALLAGDDLPDLVLVRDATPNISQILQTQAADLTPFLGGDAVKDFPNLAAIPSFSGRTTAASRTAVCTWFPSTATHLVTRCTATRRSTTRRSARTTRPKTPTISSASSSS